jgi:23S rRNA (cytidine1920-2'-O)/16S rRNA (cytidine1409-2'-O)-methyltransferase
MSKERLDMLVVGRGLAESRALAQRLIMAGQVRVNGQVVDKVSAKVEEDAEIGVDIGPRFVSRGGEKLEGALQAFRLERLDGLVCADIGSSTGGFTDCLLQHGAALVYAIDVGYGVLHWKLRQDVRVVSMERTNARYVTALPQAVNLVTVDASFISLNILLPVFKSWFPSHGGQAVVLIKPQFEAGREQAAHGSGVIRDPQVHRQVITAVLQDAQKEGFGVCGLVRSPLVGPKGNAEFLAWLGYPGEKGDVVELIAGVLRTAEEVGDERNAPP